MFEHASKISQTTKFFIRIFRTFSSKEVDFPFGLDKRSGRPEQWPKLGEKSNNIRKNRPFWGHLEKFGFQFG